MAITLPKLPPPAPKPVATPKPAAPPPPPPVQVSAPATSFASGGNRAQSWQQFNGASSSPASTPSPSASAPTFRVGFGAATLVPTTPPAMPQRTTAPRASSLLTEGIGDGSLNCLERAYTAAGPNDSVTLLRDTRDPTGHAVVERQNGNVFDPASQRTYQSMDAYLAQNSQYSLRPEPEARGISRDTLEQVFKTPPGSEARMQALDAAGLGGIARVGVADGLTPQQATEQIQGLLNSNPIDDVAYDDLMAIEGILRQLPPDQVNAAIAGLSDDQLSQWVSDLNDPGLAGGGPFRGLDSSERGSLFGLLATNLDASQASRFFEALDRPEQMVEFGQAFIRQGDVHDRLGFVLAIGDANFPDGERAGSAQVIASALDALSADHGRLSIAVQSITEQNLQDGLLAAAGASWNEMGPHRGQLNFPDMDRLQRITGAVAGTDDYRARAAVFDAMGFVVGDMVRDQPAVQDKEAVATRMTGMMTNLISDDLPMLVTHLSGANGLDPLGTALTTYAGEQLRAGGGTLGPLADQMRQLDLQNPGTGRFDNAFLSGYFAGSVFKAVDGLSPADLLGPDRAAIISIAELVIGFRTDPATGLLLSGALSEAERASIDRAMSEGGAAVRSSLLQMLGVQISPGNDNGTAVGAFEQGLFAVYGSELYQ